MCGWDRHDSADASLEREDREWPLLSPAPAGTASGTGLVLSSGKMGMKLETVQELNK